MTDKNKIPEPERSSGNEVACNDLLAELSQKALDQCVEIFNDYAVEEVRCLPPSVVLAWEIGSNAALAIEMEKFKIKKEPTSFMGFLRFLRNLN